MQILDFSGGLNTRVHPTLIAKNETVILNNVDITSGTLVPMKDRATTATTIGVGPGQLYYTIADTWVASTSASYVDFQNITVRTAGGYPQKFISGSWQNCGITPPPVPSGLSFSYISTPTTTLFNNIYDDVTYIATYYNSTDGTESQASEPFQVMSQSSPWAKYIPSMDLTYSSDPQVTHIRLYRIGQTITDFTLTQEVVNITGTGTLNVADTYSDLQIAGNTIYNGYNYGLGPSSSYFLTEHNAMLFCTNGSTKLYYTDVGKMGNWGNSFFIDFKEDITGIGSTLGGLLVFTNTQTFIVSGSDPYSLSKYLLDGTQGCVNHFSIASVNKQLIWVSTDGICTSNGGQVSVISLGKLGKLSSGSIKGAAVFDSIYYLLTGTDMLICDLRFGVSFRRASFNPDSLLVHADKLYANYSGSVYELFTGANLSMTYKSPMYTNDDASLLKLFHDLRVTYTGELTLKIYTYIKENTVTYTDTIVLYNGLFQDLEYLRYAKFIQFEITGTGNLNSIEWQAHNRYNIFEYSGFLDTTYFPESTLINNTQVVADTSGGSVITYSIPMNVTSDNIIKELYLYTKGIVTIELFYDGISKSTLTIPANTNYTYLDMSARGYLNTLKIKSSGSGKLLKVDYKAFDRYTIFESPLFMEDIIFQESILINNSKIIMSKVGITGTSFKVEALPLDLTSPSIIREMYVTFKGTITFNVLIDNIVVKTEALSSVGITTVPIVFDAIGTTIGFTMTSMVGKVYSITYSAFNRSTIGTSGAFYDTTLFPEVILVNNSPQLLNQVDCGYASDTIPFSITNLKMFRNYYLAYIGTLTFKLYIDGALVQTLSLSSVNFTVEDIKLPSHLSRGYYLKVELCTLSANSKVYAMEINPMERQTNGR